VSSSKRPPAPKRTVSLVTLGCARNEVDSEELAGRLEASGWTLTDRDDAAVVLVNTCGFIEAAKQESIAELLDGGGPGAHVVAAGCLAERYGSELAESLPEAQVLSFDDYGDIGARLDAVLAGERRPAHQPRDRRRLLPISPVRRPGSGPVHVPGHGMPGPSDAEAARPGGASAGSSSSRSRRFPRSLP
jgi:ribosomal protein S12 methylthiotransferase